MNLNRSLKGRVGTGWMVILLAGGLTLGTAWAEPVVHYLTVAGAGNEDGSSWGNASSNIQAALDIAGIDEIRMGGGIYDLSASLAWNAGTNVTVRGGYDAATGNHDPGNQVTILRQTVSGQRVMRLIDLENCRLEHVTVTGGYFNGNGGGCQFLNSTATISHCVISNNQVFGTARWDHRYGGGIYVNGGAVEVLSSRIENNIATAPSEHYQRLYGGGLYLHSGSLYVENSWIVSNQVLGAGTKNQETHSGGAGHAPGTALTLRNCLIYGNRSWGAAAVPPHSAGSLYGAGVLLHNGGLIENCTIVGNHMDNDTLQGAGLRVNGGTVTNTIVWDNWRRTMQSDISFNSGVNEADTVFYSAAQELTDGVNANINADPLFLNAAAGDFRLDRGSSCVDTGVNADWMNLAVDLDGNLRIQDGRPDRPDVVDRGAYELMPLIEAGSLVCDFGADVYFGIDEVKVVLTAFVGGSNTNISEYRWDFNDDGNFDEQGSGKRVVTNIYGPGVYSVRLEVQNDQSETATMTKTGYIRVASSLLHVSPGGNGSTGFDWINAYTDIQTAIDQPGVIEIRIAGGDYALDKHLNWIGHSGATLRGGYDASTGHHDPANQVTILRQTTSSQRVLLMNELEDCRLEYVTVTDGNGGIVVLNSQGVDIENCVIRNNNHNGAGGGIFLNNSQATIVGCVITNNRAFTTARWTHRYGGGIGVNGGTVDVLFCRIENNTATATTEHYQTLTGGGVYLLAGTLNVENSTIISNQSTTHSPNLNQNTHSGGAGHQPGTALTLRNCLIYGNATYGATVITAHNQGSLDAGGVRLNNGGLIENCTIVGNKQGNAELAGAGLRVNGGGVVTNTIVWGNLRGAGFDDPNDLGFGVSASETANIFYSCAPELTAELNHNINADPLFIDAAAGDFRLQSRYGQYNQSGALIHHAQTSPAMDAGINQPWMIDALDLQGVPRIVRGVPRSPGPANVDMGAYEVNAPLPGTMFLFR